MTPREIAMQIGLLIVVVVVIASAIRSAQVNLSELGITSGFAFLNRSTGWSYSFSLLDRSIDDPYSRTLLIGFLNTLFVGSISIVFAIQKVRLKLISWVSSPALETRSPLLME